MSLGGLAVAIGLIIDDTVVVIENIARHLSPSRCRAESESERRVATVKPLPRRDRRPRDRRPRSGGRRLRRDHRGRRRLDADDRAGVRAAGVHRRRLRPVLRSLSWSLSIAVLVSMVISLTLVPVFAAKFLAGRPMPRAGADLPLLRRRLRNGCSSRACAFPWADADAVRWRPSASASLLFTGIPDWSDAAGTGQAAAGAAGQGAGDRPDAGDGRGRLRPRLLGPDRHAAERTPRRWPATLEEILPENPDVEAYVRRTGAEIGLFATKTNRGDIQVVAAARRGRSR